eukprot:112560_1
MAKRFPIRLCNRSFLNKMNKYISMNSVFYSNSNKELDYYYNYYKDLGFDNMSRDKYHHVTISEVKRAYTRLVKECHPDKNPHIHHVESAAKLAKLKKAHSILTNPTLKSAYDNQFVPLKQDKNINHKSKSSVSYYQKLQNKTYEFNYYAAKHSKGGIGYDNRTALNHLGICTILGIVISYVLLFGVLRINNKHGRGTHNLSASDTEITENALIEWINHLNSGNDE